MLNLVKNELNRLKWNIGISFALAMLFSIFMILIKQSGYSYDYNVEIWQESFDILGMLYPAFCVLPTCWVMYYERRNNYILYTVLRVSKTKYILSKWLVAACYGFLIIFSISFIGLIISLYFIPQIVPRDNAHLSKSFMGWYLVNKPFIYGLVLSLWRGLIAFLVTTLGFVLSLFSNSIFVILSGPFAYGILENFVLSILGVPYYRLVTSFTPFSLAPSAVSFKRLLVGPLILICVIAGLIAFFTLFRRQRIFENSF